MAGTKIGGAKAAATNKARYGENWYKELGRKGGSVSTPHGGFGYSHERAVAAGRKGGTISRRGPAKPRTISEADMLSDAFDAEVAKLQKEEK